MVWVIGYAIIKNNMFGSKKPVRINLEWTSKRITPNTPTAVTTLEGSNYCAPTTFAVNVTTELNTIGCINLGYLPVGDCPIHYDAVQENLDGSGFFLGSPTEFALHCSEASRVSSISNYSWTADIISIPTSTPTSTSDLPTSLPEKLVIGISVGVSLGLLAILLLVLLILFLLRRKVCFPLSFFFFPFSLFFFL